MRVLPAGWALLSGISFGAALFLIGDALTAEPDNRGTAWLVLGVLVMGLSFYFASAAAAKAWELTR